MHDFIPNNGFFVCIHCGLCVKDEKVYSFLSERLTEKRREKLREESLIGGYNSWIKKLSPYLSGKYHFFNDWAMAINHSLYNRMKIILSHLPCSLEQKELIKKYILKKRPQRIVELYNLFYEIINNLDLAITNKKLIELIGSFTERNHFTPLKIKSTIMVRRYYWYISKILNKCFYLTNEEKEKVYKIVYLYYNFIRFKLFFAGDPKKLIRKLVYKTINQKAKSDIRRKYKSKEFFQVGSNIIPQRILAKLENFNIDSELKIQL